ncbi:MAG TPA: NAD-dependent protein deacylase [Candidatus Limnocylindria bacterium]|nr:NAD-dependent protein deacylase [Candidatus Limnocylindria bacterium]
MTDSVNPAAGALAALLLERRRAVFFGGAGVSTASGIPDFRGAQGLYRRGGRIDPETLLSRAFFLRDPETFYDYYVGEVLRPQALPNAAHRALAEMEGMGLLACVVTQNIDGLHQAAGSRCVLELHGSAHHNACLRCGRGMSLAEALAQRPRVPRCPCGGLVKPGIVLYGEGLDPHILSRAADEIGKCGLLVVAGTSLRVQPAASLAAVARGQVVLINREETPMDEAADMVVREPVEDVLAEAMRIVRAATEQS